MADAIQAKPAASPLERNLATLMAILDAFNRNDIAAIEAAGIPDLKFFAGGRSRFGGHRSGSRAMGDVLREIKELTGGTMTTAPEVIVGDDSNIMAWAHITGARPDGRTYDNYQAYLYRFRDGKLSEANSIPVDQQAFDEFVSDGDGRSTVEWNKAIAYRVYDEVWGKGDLAAAREIFSPTFRRLGPDGSPQTVGPDGYMSTFVLPSRAAFGDFTPKVLQMVAEGDSVVVRTLNTGTHRATWAGIPATGRTISFEAWDCLRFANGQIEECRGIYDPATIFRQLGVEYGPISGTGSTTANADGAS